VWPHQENPGDSRHLLSPVNEDIETAILSGPEERTIPQIGPAWLSGSEGIVVSEERP
jgi:hypothetical protein